MYVYAFQLFSFAMISFIQRVTIVTPILLFLGLLVLFFVKISMVFSAIDTLTQDLLRLMGTALPSNCKNKTLSLLTGFPKSQIYQTSMGLYGQISHGFPFIFQGGLYLV